VFTRGELQVQRRPDTPCSASHELFAPDHAPEITGAASDPDDMLRVDFST
jgi:hypothetical protein